MKIKSVGSYTVVISGNIEELEDKITNLINCGCWEPFGNLVVTSLGADVVYLQPVVEYMYTEEKDFFNE
jgi:hypothetical protein